MWGGGSILFWFLSSCTKNGGLNIWPGNSSINQTVNELTPLSSHFYKLYQIVLMLLWQVLLTTCKSPQGYMQIVEIWNCKETDEYSYTQHHPNTGICKPTSHYHFAWFLWLHLAKQLGFVLWVEVKGRYRLNGKKKSLRVTCLDCKQFMFTVVVTQWQHKTYPDFLQVSFHWIVWIFLHSCAFYVNSYVIAWGWAIQSKKRILNYG